MTEKDIYKQAVDELTTGNFDQALWSLVWTKAGGEDNLAKARYVEARVREIKAQLKLARRAGRPRLSLRVPWRLVGLTACAATFAVVNRSVARTHTFEPPAVRWDFYLVGVAGYTLGLMLIPGLALLVVGGNRWGYRIGFLMLGIGGCLAGVGGLPTFDYDRQDAVNGYYWFGFALLVAWIIYAFVLADAEKKITKDRP